jgi:hypothetical protein
MGAQVFGEIVKGKTAKEAFGIAVEEAAFEHGHGGYTGSIAEKHDFTIIDPVKDGQNVDDWSQNDYEAYACKLIEDGDERIDDKWGPAGCIEIGDGEFLFFGWASS